MRFLFFQSKCEVAVRFVFEEKKSPFAYLINLFFSLIIQTSPIGPFTDIHLRTSMAKTDSQECKYVFELSALSQDQYLDTDCEKAGDSQLGFSFSVAMLAIKRVSIWLPLKRSCSAHSIQEKRCHPKGPFMIYVSWMVLRVFHLSLWFIDTQKNLFFWQANSPWTSFFLLK